jgi:hypothetical protein
VDPKDRRNINDLAISLSREVSQKLLKLPGMKAVLVTFVGEEAPLGTLVYDTQHQGADTLLAAIERLSEHISLIARGLGDQHEAAHGGLKQPEQVSGEPDVLPDSQSDSVPPVPQQTGEESERPPDRDR